MAMMTELTSLASISARPVESGEGTPPSQAPAQEKSFLARAWKNIREIGSSLTTPKQVSPLAPPAILVDTSIQLVLLHQLPGPSEIIATDSAVPIAPVSEPETETRPVLSPEAPIAEVAVPTALVPKTEIELLPVLSPEAQLPTTPVSKPKKETRPVLSPEAQLADKFIAKQVSADDFAKKVLIGWFETTHIGSDKINLCEAAVKTVGKRLSGKTEQEKKAILHTLRLAFYRVLVHQEVNLYKETYPLPGFSIEGLMEFVITDAPEDDRRDPWKLMGTEGFVWFDPAVMVADAGNFESLADRMLTDRCANEPMLEKVFFCECAIQALKDSATFKAIPFEVNKLALLANLREALYSRLLRQEVCIISTYSTHPKPYLYLTFLRFPLESLPRKFRLLEQFKLRDQTREQTHDVKRDLWTLVIHNLGIEFKKHIPKMKCYYKYCRDQENLANQFVDLVHTLRQEYSKTHKESQWMTDLAFKQLRLGLAVNILRHKDMRTMSTWEPIRIMTALTKNFGPKDWARFNKI